MEMTQVVHSFRKNESEEVRISLRRYKDRAYVDLRIFFEARDSSEYLPTRKGLTLEAGLLAELKRGIEKVRKKLSQRTSRISTKGRDRKALKEL